MPMTIDDIWSDEYLVRLERRLWIRVMEAQSMLGPGPEPLVTDQQIFDSRAVQDHPVDLDSIHQREMVTRHDIMARLAEFVHLSGHSRIHLGMTSADVVENTYLIRQRQSLIALGLRPWTTDLQFRGIRGPVGSDVDQLNLLGTTQRVDALNRHVATRFGFEHVIGAVSQCMPRSFDLRLANRLSQLATNRVDAALVAGIVQMLGEQTFWLEGDVSSSCVRRYAWPMLFKIVEGSYTEEMEPCQD